MSTGSSGFRAAYSGQVKQKVVRLLFGPKYARKGPDAHRMLDASIYSFADLKKAYLSRVQEIHPDKIRNKGTETQKMKRSFQELQEAWKQYEELARTMKTVGSETGNESEANFTMFGVGCSFADSEEEKELRSEIMDQAGRGWFSSALIAESTIANRSGSNNYMKIRQVSLLDENLFTDVTKSTEKTTIPPTTGDKPKRKTLIPGLR